MTRNKKLRSERAKRRARKRRNQRILLSAFFVILLGGIAFWIFYDPNQNEQTEEAELNPILITTESGLQYEDLVLGEGDPIGMGDTATVHYTGWLEDGTLFDSSLGRGTPFSFTIGTGMVIAGWDEGVQGMKIGGKRRLMIPAELGYGDSGAGGGLIPPGAKLLFEVELLDIQ